MAHFHVLLCAFYIQVWLYILQYNVRSFVKRMICSVCISFFFTIFMADILNCRLKWIAFPVFKYIVYCCQFISLVNVHTYSQTLSQCQRDQSFYFEIEELYVINQVILGTDQKRYPRKLLIWAQDNKVLL
jgi:hypothetical protein